MGIPTDMGLPIEMELHLPVVASMDSKLKVMGALPKPEIQMTTRVFLNAQLTGWVGTLIPFTNEMALTAIDNSIIYNLPATVKVTVDLPKHHIKLTLQLDEKLTQKTDLVHHHVHPFTAIQKIQDFTPITLAASKKLIKSVEKVKELQTVFGEPLGLHLHARITTESRYIDVRSIIERLAMYKYNPINMLLFPTSMAMSPAGTLSLRHTDFTLKIDPTQSTTKAISADINFGMAIKAKDVQAIKYTSSRSCPLPNKNNVYNKKRALLSNS